MKKRILFPFLIAALLALGLGGYALAAGGTKIFDHNFTITVEPIEVQIKEISSLSVKPGEPVTVVYLIKNYSRDTDWNLMADVAIQDGPPGIGIGSNWTLLTMGKGGYQEFEYVPGTPFQIARDSQRELRIIFYPDRNFTGEMNLNITIYRLSGEKG